MDDTPFCIRCYEEFPVAQEPAVWQMGQLRPLSKAPKSIKNRVYAPKDDMRGKPHLCGNCYFDLTDE